MLPLPSGARRQEMKFYGTAHRAKTKLDLEGERHMENLKLESNIGVKQ